MRKPENVQRNRKTEDGAGNGLQETYQNDRVAAIPKQGIEIGGAEPANEGTIEENDGRYGRSYETKWRGNEQDKASQVIEWVNVNGYGNGDNNVYKGTQGKNSEAEIAYRKTNEDYHNSERSKRASALLVLKSNHQWKYIHAWMKKKQIEAKSKLTRDGGL